MFIEIKLANKDETIIINSSQISSVSKAFGSLATNQPITYTQIKMIDQNTYDTRESISEIKGKICKAPDEVALIALDVH